MPDQIFCKSLFFEFVCRNKNPQSKMDNLPSAKLTQDTYAKTKCYLCFCGINESYQFHVFRGQQKTEINGGHKIRHLRGKLGAGQNSKNLENIREGKEYMYFNNIMQISSFPIIWVPDSPITLSPLTTCPPPPHIMFVLNSYLILPL